MAAVRRRRSVRAKPTPAAMPRRVRPMLATLVAEPFDRAGWLFEIKWDGFRAIAEVEHGRVQLYSRNLLSFADRFAPVVAALRELDKTAVLDGEVVVLDRQGKSQFQLLQNYQRERGGELVYYVFDLLYHQGRDLRSEPLRLRKQLLAELVEGQRRLRFSEHVEEHGIAFFQAATKQGLEGIIAKNGASPYREGIRSTDWLKIKVRQRQEAVIGGFTAPRRSRQAFGALLLGVYEGHDLVYIGHAGGGFDTASLRDVHARLLPLVQKTCPFKARPKPNAAATWVRPTMVCEVVFQEWTQDGTMRQPIFVGLRDDKDAPSVTRELAAR